MSEFLQDLLSLPVHDKVNLVCIIIVETYAENATQDGIAVRRPFFSDASCAVATMYMKIPEMDAVKIMYLQETLDDAYLAHRK